VHGNGTLAEIFLETTREITVSSQPLLLNLVQAAELLGLKPSNLYELTRRRSLTRQRVPLPYVRLGKRLAFRRESLERWIAQLEGEVRQ
jgi:predicted DNA-binding transcriptional regulator AlpA